jgi:glycosyltransferase involved in cell wall biosynthesis
MRILNIFNNYLERGGEAQSVDAIVDSLSDVLEIERCDFQSTDWIGPGAPGKCKQALWMIRNPASLKKLREHQLRIKPSVWLVHNVFPVGSAAIYPEAECWGVPIIQYIHNFRPFSVNGYLWAGNGVATGGLSKNYWREIRYGAWQASFTKTAWLAFVLGMSRAFGWWENVKAWIAVSNFMRDKFISAGISANSIFTLRHFWRPRSKVDNSVGPSHYLYLGRLIEAKGVLVLLGAWKIIEQELRADSPRLVVAGDGPLRSHVKSCSERMKSVNFVGHLSQDEKHRALEEARAVIVPSLWWEPLGLVVYEAYDYSKPVLAAASGGLQEIVLDHQTGVLHEPGNAAQLARQIIELEKDAEGCRAMGQRGRLWLEQNADESQWQTEFLKIANYALHRGSDADSVR